MAKYRKKPVEIEAFQFYVDEIPDWFMDKVSSNEVILRNCNYNQYEIDEAYCEISTLEGVMRGNGGDYIIKGVNGEIYPCKPDIFEKTYNKSGDRQYEKQVIIIGSLLLMLNNTVTKEDFEKAIKQIDMHKYMKHVDILRSPSSNEEFLEVFVEIINEYIEALEDKQEV